MTGVVLTLASMSWGSEVFDNFDYGEANGLYWEIRISGWEAEITYVRDNKYATYFTGSDLFVPKSIAGRTIVGVIEIAQLPNIPGNKYIETVRLPDTIQYLQAGLFRGCTSLRSVRLSSSLTEIADSLFCGCSSLESMDIPKSITTIEKYSLSGTAFTSVAIPSSVKRIGTGAFSNCNKLKSISVPASTEIGDGAFRSCSSLQSFNIPSKATSISAGMLQNCTSLNEIEIPASVVSIEGSAFQGCSNLVDVSFGATSKVETISVSAFSDCSSLATISLPKSLAQLYRGAFAGCSSLKYVCLEGELPSVEDKYTETWVESGAFRTVEYWEKTLFKSTPADLIVYVPADSASASWKGKTWPYPDEDGRLVMTYKDTVAVTFDANGGETATVIKAYSGLDPYGELPVPTRLGYSFAGWWTEKEGGNQVLPDTRAGDDVTYYAHWTLVATCDIDNGVLTNVKLGENVSSFTIPDGVTSIGRSAFAYCRGLKSVIIPDSVTSIGYSAFKGCSGLTSLTIPDGVTSIGDYAFLWCSSLTSVTIPDGVRSIGMSAFKGCSGLTSLTIPDGVTSIGASAFTWCGDSLFDTTTIPGVRLLDGWIVDCVSPPSGHLDVVGVRGIANSVFRNSSGLTSVMIGDGVTSIGDSVFRGCGGLTSVTIPDSVTSIGNSAFHDCAGLTSVTIGNGVTNIGGNAFCHCSRLTSVTIPDAVTSVGGAAFYACSGLTSVTIGEGVTSIGYSAFKGCIGLTSVIIPDGVTSIGHSAFEGCSGLTSVSIPASVMTIGKDAFYGCNGIREATVPGWQCGVPFRNVTSLIISVGTTNIESRAFYDCWRLTSVSIPTSVTTIGKDAFYGCNGIREATVPGWQCGVPFGYVTNLIISVGTTKIEYDVFNRCDRLKSVTIPDSVTSIGDKAFEWCSGLKSVIIPDSVTSIGYSAFKGCSGLTSLTIPDGVTSIGDYAFSWCSSLTSVTIPDGVTSIGYEAFYGCSGLTSVTLPASVTSIGVSAFIYCVNLSEVYAPAAVKSQIVDAFGGSQNLRNVKVYCGDVYVKLAVDDDCVGMGTVSGNGAYSAGKKVTLKATPAKGCVFAGWRRAEDSAPYQDELLSKEASFAYVVPTNHVTIVARFAKGDDDAASLVVNVEDVTTAADGTIGTLGEDGKYSLDLSTFVSSLSQPKLAVSGLPSGVKYDAKTMTVSGKATKPGVYEVTVSATNATVKKPVTATFSLVVPNLTCDALPNLMPETYAYGTVQCGVAFDPGLVDCSPEDGWAVKVAGLPVGLKYDAKTGKITGVPTKAGTFTVTFTATKGKEKEVATITLTTEALPTWAAGTFTGYVKENGGSTVFGPATMTVAASGKISGKFTLSGTNWTFAAASYAAVDGEGFIVDAVAKAGKATMPVEMRLYGSSSPDTDGKPLVNASAEGGFGGSDDTYIYLWRNMWKDKATSAETKAVLAGWEGVYTLSMEDGGYASLTVGKNGDVKVAGKLADGTALSATSPFMYDICKDFFTVFALSPSAYKGGFVYLPVGFGTERGRLDGLGHALVWSSRNPQATYAYGEGFERWTQFTGAYYDKAKKLSDYYEALQFATEAPVLYYTFKETYLGGNNRKTTESYMADAYAADTLGQEGTTVSAAEKGFAVAKATKPVQDRETKEWYYEGANDGALALSFAQATGIFKGSYTFWYDYVSAYDGTKPDGKRETYAHASKKVSFEGILVQGEEPKMNGFYLWDATGVYEDEKTGKEKTYKYKESFPVMLLSE